MFKNSTCPIGMSLELFNRKWVLCILTDLFNGNRRFNEFKQSNPKISSQMLSETLKYMENNDLIYKKDNEYNLTEKGLETNAILYEMAKFNMKYSDYDNDVRAQSLNEYRELLKLG